MQKLNLLINDHAGVPLLAPLVQDSLVSSAQFNKAEQSFELHLNRVAHEHSHKEPLRINSYLMIPTALSVHHNGPHESLIDLNLLTLDSSSKAENHYLFLIFSNNRTLRITMSEMMFRLWDFGEHWTSPIPKHAVN